MWSLTGLSAETTRLRGTAASRGMRAMPIVAVQPGGQRTAALLRMTTKPSVGPLAEGRFDEASALPLVRGV